MGAIWLPVCLSACLTACLTACGCDRDERRAPPPPPPAAGPAPPRDLAKFLGVDAGEIEAHVDPPAPAGDLAADIEHFTTLDACVAERSRLDPLVGDALEAIGYDTFLRDTCRLLDAAKALDPGRCRAIEASSLEAQCRIVVAQVKGDPDLCPWQMPRRPARGRDAKCVALAERDARLCASVEDALERATCEDALRGGRWRSASERAPCAALPSSAEQARCRRDADRWTAILTGPDRSGGGERDRVRCEVGDASVSEAAPRVVGGTVHLEPQGATQGAARGVDLDLAPDLARGVVIVVERDGTRLAIGPLSEHGVDFIAPSPHVRGTFAMDVTVPLARGPAANASATEGVARVDRAELLLPGRAPMTAPGGKSALTATVDGAPRCRGSSVHFTVDGEIGGADSGWRLHAEGTTFVRDIVRGAAGLGVVQ